MRKMIVAAMLMIFLTSINAYALMPIEGLEARLEFNKAIFAPDERIECNFYFKNCLPEVYFYVWAQPYETCSVTNQGSPASFHFDGGLRHKPKSTQRIPPDYEHCISSYIYKDSDNMLLPNKAPWKEGTYHVELSYYLEGIDIVRVTNCKGMDYALTGSAYYHVLAPPTNLIAKPDYGKRDIRIELSWKDNSKIEDGYKIERKIDSGKWKQITIMGPDTTSYSNTGISEGHTYHYRIRTTNRTGDSSYSNIATITIPPSIP